MSGQRLLFSSLVAFFLSVPFSVEGQGIGVSGFTQEGADSSKPMTTLVNDGVKIDPFYATYRGVEGAGLRYDSLTWDFEGIQNYHPMFNPHFNLQTLGDAGMPAVPRLINQEREAGFYHGWQLYDGYLYRHENAPFLRAFTPFTRLHYVQAPKEYVHLQGLHSQNITPGWNIALRFQTINNAGFYPRQRNSLRQLGLSSRYMDLTNRYYMQVSINFNRMSFEENGGWADEANFDSLTGINKNGEVRLNNSANLYSNREYAVEQVYWFAGTYKKTSDTTRYFRPVLGLKHQSVFGKTFNRFHSEGGDLLRFPAIYLDSLQTRDSTAIARQTHRIGVVNYITDSSQFFYYAGMGVELQRVHFLNFAKTSPANNLFADVELRWEPAERLKLEANGKLYFAGFNAGDVHLDGTLSYSPKNKRKKATTPIDKRTALERLYIHLTFQNRTPAFIFHTYYSNHAQWNQVLGKENVLRAEGGISGRLQTGDWGVKFVNSVVANPVYMDYDITPQQLNGVVNQTELWLLKNLKVGKFHLNNRIIFQLQANADIRRIMPTPALSTYNSLFYQNDLFREALKLQLGVDFRWFSEYYANAYDPVTRMFYIQNRRQQGNYPLIDVFAAAEVKTFRSFVKMEHANFGLWDEQFPNLYYSTPAYSLAPRRLVFGIAWKFYK